MELRKHFYLNKSSAEGWGAGGKLNNIYIRTPFTPPDRFIFLSNLSLLFPSQFFLSIAMSASDTTDSSRNDGSSTNFKRAAPIPILDSPHRRRPSNSSSDGSPTSPTVQTPTSIYPNGIAPSSPTGTSLFSYLLSSSPKSASFPITGRRPQGFVAPPVFEGLCHSRQPLSIIPLSVALTDDDGQEIEVRSSRDLHHRRATSGWSGNGRTPPSPTSAGVAPPVIEAQHARGAGVLRRLSLGGGLGGVRQI
jgi:hypothetical protein